MDRTDPVGSGVPFSKSGCCAVTAPPLCCMCAATRDYWPGKRSRSSVRADHIPPEARPRRLTPVPWLKPMGGLSQAATPGALDAAAPQRGPVRWRSHCSSFRQRLRISSSRHSTPPAVRAACWWQHRLSRDRRFSELVLPCTQQAGRRAVARNPGRRDRRAWRDSQHRPARARIRSATVCGEGRRELSACRGPRRSCCRRGIVGRRASHRRSAGTYRAGGGCRLNACRGRGEGLLRECRHTMTDWFREAFGSAYLPVYAAPRRG